MKKFLIFILTLILLSIISFTACLFIGPCKTKIKEIIPEKYHQYIDKFSFENNSTKKETVKIDLNQEENKEDLTKADLEDNIPENNGKLNEKIIEKNNQNKEDSETSLEGQKGENRNSKTNLGEIKDKKEISKKDLENLKEKLKNSEKIIEKNSGKIENSDNNLEDKIAQQKKEEYKQKLLARLNKNKKKEKEIVKTKKITITKDGKKIEVEAKKFLGNSMYFTQDKQNTYLYLKDTLLYTIKNSSDFFDKKTIDENPDLITEGPVIRAEILKKFSLKKLGENVFLLTEKKWENNKLYLIDAKNKKIIPLNKNFSHDIKKAELSKKGVVFLVDKKFYEGGVYYVNRNTKIVLPIFKNSDSSIEKNNLSYKKANFFTIKENNIGEPIVEINITGPRGVEIIRHIEF